MTQRRRSARAIVLPACFFYLAACQVGCQPDDAVRPDSESPAAPPEAANRPIGNSAQRAALAAALEDAGTRLASSLDDRVDAAIVRIHLNDLAARIAAGDEAGVRRAITSTRKALASAAGDEARPDVVGSAIQLVLDHAEAVLDGRDVTQPATTP